jgi:hypothetical protein
MRYALKLAKAACIRRSDEMNTYIRSDEIHTYISNIISPSAAARLHDESHRHFRTHLTAVTPISLITVDRPRARQAVRFLSHLKWYPFSRAGDRQRARFFMCIMQIECFTESSTGCYPVATGTPVADTSLALMLLSTDWSYQL